MDKIGLYKPGKQDGNIQGGSDLRDAGSGTGVSDTYGADIGRDAENVGGKFSAKSDPVFADLGDINGIPEKE